MIDIPTNLECKDCTIRLVRQALEWSQKYLFWSCADIDIVQPGEYKEDCSGHGRPIAGRCRCDRLYYGKRGPKTVIRATKFGKTLPLGEVLNYLAKF